jgi:hypothetical protein
MGACRDTLRGLGPAEGEITDDDIFEVNGVVKRTTVRCPPPSTRPGTSYSYAAPRGEWVETVELHPPSTRLLVSA